MSTIVRFEDLDCWKQARALVAKVYQVSSSGNLSKDFDARSQFRRAAISVMNNIAEGFTRKSNKEFIRFLGFSESSAAEVKSMLYIFEDINYLSEDSINELHDKVDAVRKLTLGLIRYLKTRPNSFVKEDGLSYKVDGNYSDH